MVGSSKASPVWNATSHVLPLLISSNLSLALMESNLIIIGVFFEGTHFR